VRTDQKYEFVTVVNGLVNAAVVFLTRLGRGAVKKHLVLIGDQSELNFLSDGSVLGGIGKENSHLD
jgi:hypothetical protein